MNKRDMGVEANRLAREWYAGMQLRVVQDICSKPKPEALVLVAFLADALGDDIDARDLLINHLILAARGKI